VKAVCWLVVVLVGVGGYPRPSLASEDAPRAATAPQTGDLPARCYDISRPGCVCITEDQADKLVTDKRVEAKLAEMPPPPELTATPPWIAASVGVGFLLGMLSTVIMR